MEALGRQDETALAETMLTRQYTRLVDILRECGSVCIGYSGGVDSVFLAKVAVDVLGRANVLAVTGRSAAYPRVQLEMALECVRRFDIPHAEVATHELSDPNYATNPSNRCYFCKAELWSRLGTLAAARGLAVVLDGSNADDAGDHRPGMLAARERAVRSPLLEAGLSKAAIRGLSKRHGLPTWDQPAAPCLASRLPYGLAVTPERLRQIEAAEELVRDRGFRDVRVRHHGDVARVELPAGQIPSALQQAAALDEALRALGFQRALIDVEGYRRGALNEGLTPLVRSGEARLVAAVRVLRGPEHEHERKRGSEHEHERKRGPEHEHEHEHECEIGRAHV